MTCRDEQMNAAPRAVSAALFCVLCASPGLATPQDYCEAYARDFADRGPREESVWAARQRGALADCLLQFQPVRSEPQAPSVQPKPVKKLARAKPVKAKEKPAPEPDVAETLPEPAVIVAPDIAPPAKATRKAAAAPAPAPPPKRNTLISRLFKPKAEAEAVTGKRGRPEPFSAAWLDYCDRKYASFNRATGTYTSFKGIERKCLVTD